MKSILNEVNRLEKAYELLVRLVQACDAFKAALEAKGPLSLPAKEFLLELQIARAFLAKYGEVKYAE